MKAFSKYFSLFMCITQCLVEWHRY